MNSRQRYEARIAALTSGEREEIRAMVKSAKRESPNFRIRRDDGVVCRRADGAPRIAPAKLFQELDCAIASSGSPRPDPTVASVAPATSPSAPASPELCAGGSDSDIESVDAQPAAGPDDPDDPHGTRAHPRPRQPTSHRRFALLVGAALVACLGLYWAFQQNAEVPQQAPADASQPIVENAAIALPDASASHYSAFGPSVPPDSWQVTSEATEALRRELDAAKDAIARQQAIIDSLRLTNANLEERLRNLERAYEQEKREAQQRYARSVVEENRTKPR